MPCIKRLPLTAHTINSGFFGYFRAQTVIQSSVSLP